MIYLRRAHQIAAAQDERHALAREADGYTRVPYAVYLQAWRVQDARTRAAMAEQDEREKAARERARIKGALPGVVYPREVR